MSEIVGVHGIAQEQLGRHLLRAPWRDSLSDGIERAGRRVEDLDLDVAFYGDLFLADKADGNKSIIEGMELEDMREEEINLVATAAEEVLCNSDFVAEGKAPKGFPGIPPNLARLVAALDRRFGRYARALFVGELRQVRRYLSDAVLRDEVDARVDGAVAGSHGRTCRVLVGHSLGSVVAFEYLRRHPDHHLLALVTLGSPLGLRAIRDALPSAAGSGPAAPPVSRWINLRDPRDPVALAGGLSRWWPTVEDDDSLDNGRDPHAATRYLGKRQVGSAVLPFLPDPSEVREHEIGGK